MRRIVTTIIVSVALAVSVAARGQDGRDLSDEARTRYAKTLKDAATLVQQRRFADAREALDKLIADRPHEPQARFLLGVVEAESGNDDAATKTFTELVQEFPELPEPHNNLAVLYAKRGNVEGARTELEFAIRAAPDWAVAHENLGDLHARSAAEHYERAAKLDHLNKTAAAKLALARNLIAASPNGAASAAGDVSPPK